MWSGIGGAVVGGLMSAGNTFLQAFQGNSSNKKATKRNYRYYLRSLEQGPTSQRKGLEDAGYNPMLALGNVGGSYSAQGGGVTPSLADSVGGAKAGAMLENALKEQKARIANVKADTELKEGQLSETESRRLQNEANTSLMHSQTERTDLAYGLDVANTLSHAAGVGAQAYSAKAMADNFKPKGKTANPSNAGKPVIQSTPKAKPNAAGTLGGSAKSVTKTLGKIGAAASALTAGYVGGKYVERKSRELNSKTNSSPKGKERVRFRGYGRLHSFR